MNHAMKIVRSAPTLTLVAVLSAGWCSRVAQGSERLTSGAARALEPVGFLVRTNYHGWADSILVSNGRVEAVIVPAVGRVMQFRFAGEEDPDRLAEQRLLVGHEDADTDGFLHDIHHPTALVGNGVMHGRGWASEPHAPPTVSWLRPMTRFAGQRRSRALPSSATFRVRLDQSVPDGEGGRLQPGMDL